MKRYRTRNLLLLTGIAFAAMAGGLSRWPVSAGLGTASADGQQIPTITPELRRELSNASAGERVPVLIELSRLEPPPLSSFDRRSRAAEQASNLADLYSGSVEQLRRESAPDLALDLFDADLLWVGGAIAAELMKEQVEALDANSAVNRIYYDGLLRVDLSGSSGEAQPPLWLPGLPAVQDLNGGLPWGLEAIGAPRLWESGATGQGAVIAIIDSGVDRDHPLVRRKWKGLTSPPEEAWFDPWGITAEPNDDNGTGGVGHGTIVTTIALGSLAPGDTLVEADGSLTVVQDQLEVVTGVAPGAQWVAVNAFEEFGGFSYTRRSILLQALQWTLDPDGNPGSFTDVPHAVNNSWGFASDGCDGTFDRAIDALELAGVPVVFASGNRSLGVDTIAAPASRADLLLNAFSIGAADLQDDEIIVAENSLGGPSPCGPDAVKPEVVAPGSVPLVSMGSPTRAVVRGRSGAFTSWAAPHATGALAVLHGLSPESSGDDLKAALFSTADDLPPTGLDNRSGAGLIDLVAAAEQVGGLGGVSLALTTWAWDSTSEGLTLQLYNRGRDGFIGGEAQLRRSGFETIARSTAPAIAPGRQGRIAFALERGVMNPDDPLTVRLLSEGVTLDFPLSSSRAPASAVLLEDGSVQVSVDANGRLGKVAGPPGFSFLGEDWLTAGGLLFGIGDLVSDATYVDVQARPELKSSPVGSDTDWGGTAENASGTTARANLSLSDRRALRPLGATVDESVRLVAIGDSAAFVALDVELSFAAGNESPLAGLMLDWDFAGRDSVAWDRDAGASIMTSAEAAGPWMALTTWPRPPTTHAAVPLGSASFGFFDLGTGVLAQSPFSDEEKSLLMRLGGESASRSRTADWAQMVSVGPLRSGERVFFLIAAGSTETAMRAALDSARVFAAQTGAGGVTPTVVSGLDLMPPFPNPFDPNDGGLLKLPFLVTRGQGVVQSTLEIYTISGRLVYTEEREITADLTVEPFEWDGRLADGEAVATGVYGYIIQVGRERKSGKFVILK